MLILDDIEVTRAGQRVVSEVSVSSASPGVLSVVGAGGAGKSSLLAALAQTDKTILFTGRAELDGHAIGAPSLPALWIPQDLMLESTDTVAQEMKKRFGVDIASLRDDLAECDIDASEIAGHLCITLPLGTRRLLAIAANLRRRADLYLIDEPTAGIDELGARFVRERIRTIAERAAIIVVTHNRQDCLALGGRTALLAGGRIQESAETSTFFTAPSTAAAKTYVETGNCNLPSPPAADAQLGIFWVVPKVLSGMSRPGLIGDIHLQVRHLFENGSRMLVCLEERRPYDIDVVRNGGLEFHHFPIADMAAPSFDQALSICRLAESAIRAKRGVTVHCRGGLGRTGVVLASILIWFGDSPDVALARVRGAERHALQSVAQVSFIFDFADRIRGWELPAERRMENVD